MCLYHSEKLRIPKNFHCKYDNQPTRISSEILASSAHDSSTNQLLRYSIKGDIDLNKSICIGIMPYEDTPGKKTFGDKSAPAKLLAISPSISVFPIDFLGMRPRRLRYTDQRPAGAIQGPVDRSEVKRKLYWMKTAKKSDSNLIFAGSCVVSRREQRLL